MTAKHLSTLLTALAIAALAAMPAAQAKGKSSGSSHWIEEREA